MKPLKLKAVVLTAVILSIMLFSARGAEAEERLSLQQKQEAVRAITEVYAKRYVFPELGEKMAELLRSRLAAGEYNDIPDGRGLGRRITQDLRSICADLHVTAAYMPERIQRRKKTDPRVRAEEELQDSRRGNFGFQELRILPGNIGYLKISGFEGSPEAFAKAAASLQFISDCDAVILDVRFNPGGDSAMVQFLASFFLKDEPVLLDEFHYREDNRIEQLWSLPYVPGKKIKDADLYILIDGFTFSAAEGLAYDLKALKRAVIAGEPSAGGAHVAVTETVLDSFLLYVPVAFSKNPVTQTNFQGKGIQPDFKASGELALRQVQLHALEKLLLKPLDPALKAELEEAKEKVRESLTPPAAAQ